MSEARLPLAYRDGCANLLIPLNRCRYEEYYLPWKCEVSEYRVGTTETKRVVVGNWQRRTELTTIFNRQRDIATKSANTTNSRSELRRWTS